MRTSGPSPCPEWAAWLPLTHPADLSPERRVALEAHLTTCMACAAVRADYQRMDARIRAWPSDRLRQGLPPALIQLWAREGRQRSDTDRKLLSWSTEKSMRTHEEKPVSLPPPIRPAQRRQRRVITWVTASAAALMI